MSATETQDPPMSQGEREASADFDPGSNGHGGAPPDPGDDGEGRSIEDLEAAGETPSAGEEDDGQMFILEQGRKVTLSSLVKRGTPTTFEVKLTGKVLKGPGSLIAFDDPDVMLVVPARGGKVDVDPVYDADGRVKEVHVRQNVKARTFYDARTEAGQVALRGE